MKRHAFSKCLTTVTMMVVSMCFIQAYAFDSSVNLALSKPATARDTWDGDGGVYSPSKVADGSLSTSWMALPDANGNGSWVYIDLQNNYLVNKVVIVWNSNRWPGGAWKLQVATNTPDGAGNSNWVDVYNGIAGSDVVSGIGTYTFSTLTGRYVRMLGASQSSSWGYHINEMNVYSDCATSQGAAPSLAIFPSSKILKTTQLYQFPSAILDANGVPLNVSYTPTWAIQGSPAGATINATSGEFRATQTGTYTITCGTTYNSISLSASATVTVNAFDINQNLALNKPVTANSSAVNITFAVDGNNGSRLEGGDGGVGNAWLKVDLGDKYDLSKFQIRWEGAYSQKYEIYTSLNGTDWTLSKTVARTLSSPGNFEEEIAMTASAQFIKFQGVTAATGYNTSFYEFRVFGSGYYVAVETPVLTSVTINPASVIPGSTSPLVIVPKNQLDAIFNGATINVVVTNTDDSPTTGATITNNGDGTFSVTGVTQGTYKLTATATKDAISVTATATLTVTEARRVATINLTTPFAITKYATNRAIDLILSCVDQYGAAITPTIVWDIQGAASGSVTNNKYTPTNKGTGIVKATSTTSAGLIESQSLTYDVITNAANVALNKPVTSISTATTAGSNAVDGNEGSQWVVPDPGSSIYNAWLVIDLQANYLIELVEVMWEGAYSKTFTVDYSENGVDFTTKYAGSNSGGTVTKDNKFYSNPSKARYVRIYSTEAGSGYGTKILEIYIHGKDASVTNNFRTTGSGNWNDLSTWQTSSDNINWTPAVVFPTTYANSIEIESAQTITLTENLSASDVNIKAGGKLTLNSGKTLTANSLTLNSDATGTATYVDNGTTTVTTATVQQYLPAARNWYISSPITTKTVPTGSIYFGYQESGDNSDFAGVSGATAYWKPYREGTSLTAGKGYIAQPSGETTLAFNGTLNTGNTTVQLSRTASATKPGFNLVGNPYPSYLNWNAVTKTNVGTTCWYRTKTAPDLNSNTSYVFDTYNATGNEHTNLGATTVSNLIPPMQAFWVRIDAGQTTGSLTFNNSMRSHADVSNNKMKISSSPKLLQQTIHLQISNGLNKDETVVYFNPNASNGFDTYDSPKMTNDNAAIPEIFTVADNQQLVINGMNSLPLDTEIPLGFTTKTANTFTITASEMVNLDSGVRIILKDKQNLSNPEQDLTSGIGYSFSSEVTSSANRFSIIFKSPSITTGIEKPETNALNIQVYKNLNNQIIIKLNENQNGTVTICNAIGQNLYNNKLTGTSTVINRSFGSGVYFVKVDSNGVSATRKIVIN